MERLHQEDFCQALGIPPEMNYEVEGDHTSLHRQLSRVAEGLRAN